MLPRARVVAEHGRDLVTSHKRAMRRDNPRSAPASARTVEPRERATFGSEVSHVLSETIDCEESERRGSVAVDEPE